MSHKIRRILLAGLITLLILTGGFILWTLLFNRPALINSRGRHHYRNEDYTDAERQFRINSLRPEADSIADANLARSQYRQGKYNQSEQTLKNYLNKDSRQHQSHAWYDRGNASFRQNKYQEALDSYKQSLLLNPANEDAKANFELVLQMLQQDQDQQKKEQEQPKQDEQKEDILNRLRALDQKEALDRQQQSKSAQPQGGRWW